MTLETTLPDDSPQRHWPARLPVVAAVLLSFAVDSFARYPVPGPNEPHYLCKAKHYWDPAWCSRDLFLASSDAHLVFYQTLGLLTRSCSLETTAIVGRLLGLFTLAVGWTALAACVVPGRWSALWAAWIFLAISAVGSLSGEWLVGGIEAKVFAYGFLFAAIAAGINGYSSGRGGQIVLAGVLAGLAVSLHPVVGIWGLASALFASAAVGLSRSWGAPGSQDRLLRTRLFHVRFAWYAAGVAAAILLAIPGVIAGLRSASASSVAADYIQVYYRLAHHLDPLHFATSAWILYGMLAAYWLLARRLMARGEAESWFAWFVCASALVALVGFAVGWRSGPPEHVSNYLLPWRWLGYPWRWKVLKLYPFRLFDALLPVAVAFSLAGLARRWCCRVCEQPTARPRRTVPAIWLLFAAPALAAMLQTAPDARPPMSGAELSDWVDACRWIERNTPQDALFLTPTQQSWAFKWYAQRAEFVSYKDCPQDGPGIIEWNQRLLFLKDWLAGNLARKYTAADMGPLRERGIANIIWRKPDPFDLKPVYENSTFRVYHLDDQPARPGT